jgi:hypothetical protein
MAELDITITGKLSEDCKSILIDNVESIIRILYIHKDTPLEVNLKKFHRQRTVAQNSYVWGVMIPTIRSWQLETTGSCNSEEAIYAFLRITVIGDEVVIEEVQGVDTAVVKGKRFSQCTTVEFAERVDKIILYYAERGLEIKLPVPKSNNYLNNFSRDTEVDLVTFCRKCGTAHSGKCNQIKDE